MGETTSNTYPHVTTKQHIVLAIRKKINLHHERVKRNRISYLKRRKEITEIRERAKHLEKKRTRIELAKLNACHIAVTQSERAAQRKLRQEIQELRRLKRDLKDKGYTISPYLDLASLASSRISL